MSDRSTNLSPEGVYLAYDGRVANYTPKGYLVTEPGVPGVPVAYVQAVSEAAPDEDAFQAACDILRHPELAERIYPGKLHVTDLRHYCRPGSTHALPTWLWGMTYSRCNDSGHEHPTEGDNPDTRIVFNDRVLLAELTKLAAGGKTKTAGPKFIADAAVTGTKQRRKTNRSAPATK